MGWWLIRHLSPEARLVIGSILFDGSLICWPLSLIYTTEPPIILSISWLAITLTGWNIIETADVSKAQGREGNSG